MSTKLYKIDYDMKNPEKSLDYDKAEEKWLDTTDTRLSLWDYDWINYEMFINVAHREQGLLRIKFRYNASKLSSMYVKQAISEEDYTRHLYTFPSQMFEEYLKVYLVAQLQAVHKGRWFRMGEPILINFFNDVLDKYTQYYNEEQIIEHFNKEDDWKY